jgi:hypothetical protein
MEWAKISVERIRKYLARYHAARAHSHARMSGQREAEYAATCEALPALDGFVVSTFQAECAVVAHVPRNSKRPHSACRSYSSSAS